jgi:hypothetical protein
MGFWSSCSKRLNKEFKRILQLERLNVFFWVELGVFVYTKGLSNASGTLLIIKVNFIQLKNFIKNNIFYRRFTYDYRLMTDYKIYDVKWTQKVPLDG